MELMGSCGIQPWAFHRDIQAWSGVVVEGQGSSRPEAEH